MCTKLSNCAPGARESRTSWRSCQRGLEETGFCPQHQPQKEVNRFQPLQSYSEAGALTKGPISQATYPLELKSILAMALRADSSRFEQIRAFSGKKCLIILVNACNTLKHLNSAFVLHVNCIQNMDRLSKWTA